MNFENKSHDSVNKRIDVLDGLRALAMLLVFNVHFLNRYMSVDYFVRSDSLLFRIISSLNGTVVTVDLFFIISGYLIFDILKNRPVGAAIFFERRFGRLFAPHLAVICYIVFLRGLNTFTPGVFSLNLFFIAPLFPGVETYNSVTWTLAWEWIYYILIFFTMSIFSKRDEWFIFLVLCLLSATLAIVSYFNIVNIHFPEFGRFISFYFGIILAIILKSRSEKLRKGIKCLLPVSLVMIPTLAIIWTYKAEVIKALPMNGLYYIIASCCFLVIIFDSMVNKGLLNKIFSNVLIKSLGRISYSIYLIHSFVIMEVLNRMSPAENLSGIIFRYCVVLLTTIGLGTISYFLFEYYFVRRPSESV